MRKTLYALVTGSILLISCKGNDAATSSTGFDSSIVTPARALANAAIDTTHPENTVQPISLPATTGQATGALNPAHGQPGHRCELAVGAPLNSAPTQASKTSPAVTATPTIGTTTPVITSQPALKTAITPTTTTTAPGMNPAHGQPGHRCDIAVGAPLSSAPTKSNITTTPTTSKTTAVPTPAVINSPVSATPVAAGMNPAHGQPGHRCDIAVGAPLNSPVKAATTDAKKDSSGHK